MTRSRLGVLLAAGAVAGLVTVAAFAPIAVAAGPLDVSIVDTAFQPSDLTVHVGDTVTWTVTKAFSQPHSVTSGTPGGSDSGKVFDSGIDLRNNGDSFPFTFNTPGTYPFYCQVHPTTMTGTITVLAAGASAPPAASAAPTTAPSTAPTAAPSAAASQAPAASAGASGAPVPSASPAPPGSEREPVPAADKAIAAAVLGIALLLLFGSAVLYRRMNRG
ncbi:MAG TPA: plastocyanin/azurin family copper-binding protein [Candidatus Limnocylindrales bacterium]